MKAIRCCFLQMLQLIRRDMMLAAACAAPLIAGVAFRFLIPLLEKILVQQTQKTAILSPYYGLFDLFYAMLAPTLFCFAAAMVILEERDAHIQNYLFITRVGRIGYLISRIGIPACFALVITAVLLPIFQLTAHSVVMLAALSITGTLQGIIVALLIVTISTNKLEGMAVSKLATLTILGAFAPYFIPNTFQYVVSFLPSFWVGKAMHQSSAVFMIPALILSGFWILLLLKRFSKN